MPTRIILITRNESHQFYAESDILKDNQIFIDHARNNQLRPSGQEVQTVLAMNPGLWVRALGTYRYAFLTFLVEQAMNDIGSDPEALSDNLKMSMLITD